MSLRTVRRDCAISCRPVFVEPHDVAARVDPDGQSEKRIWEIKRGECASAQQKGVNVPVVGGVHGPAAQYPLTMSPDALIAAKVGDAVPKAPRKSIELNAPPLNRKPWHLPSGLRYRPAMSPAGLIPRAV